MVVLDRISGFTRLTGFNLVNSVNLVILSKVLLDLAKLIDKKI